MSTSALDLTKRMREDFLKSTAAVPSDQINTIVNKAPTQIKKTKDIPAPPPETLMPVVEKKPPAPQMITPQTPLIQPAPQATFQAQAASPAQAAMDDSQPVLKKTSMLSPSLIRVLRNMGVVSGLIATLTVLDFYFDLHSNIGSLIS